MSMPIIAIRRRAEALKKFTFKIEKLQELLDSGFLEFIPSKMKPATFVAWEDKQLGVYKFSRNALYEDSEDYLILIARMNALLATLSKKRAKNNRKEDASNLLRNKLAAAERKAQNFLNQYTVARSALEDKDKRIIRLEDQLREEKKYSSKVVPFKIVK